MCVCVCVCVCVSGTEAHTLAVEVWEDFRKCLVSDDSSPSDGCHVGMQQLEFSLHSFTAKFSTLRERQRCSVYSMVERDYVKSIGLFLRQLCFCLIDRICGNIIMDSTKSETGQWSSLSLHVCV